MLGHPRSQTSNLRASNQRTISTLEIPQKCGRRADSHLVIFMAVSLHCSTKESTVKINNANISKLYIKDAALQTRYLIQKVYKKPGFQSLAKHNVPRGPY